MASHGAFAKFLLGDNGKTLEQVKANLRVSEISEKLKALLVIADKVRADGRSVSEEDVAEARKQGATDRDIHDTVLVAAAFSMYNRYVDGLGTWAPEDLAMYDAAGERVAREGYLRNP